jgi:hypothetical protein
MSRSKYEGGLVWRSCLLKRVRTIGVFFGKKQDVLEVGRYIAMRQNRLKLDKSFEVGVEKASCLVQYLSWGQ